jgi:hypothetical protein
MRKTCAMYRPQWSGTARAGKFRRALVLLGSPPVPGQSFDEKRLCISKGGLRPEASCAFLRLLDVSSSHSSCCGWTFGNFRGGCKHQSSCN